LTPPSDAIEGSVYLGEAYYICRVFNKLKVTKHGYQLQKALYGSRDLSASRSECSGPTELVVSGMVSSAQLLEATYIQKCLVFKPFLPFKLRTGLRILRHRVVAH
jgi:hypothetical protein